MFTTKKQAPTPPQQYRQGDVLLTRIESALPAGATAVQRDRGRVILAYGEVTGHAHAIDDTITEPKAALYDTKDGGFVLCVEDEVGLVHEEHARIDLAPGAYRLTHQREYSPEEIRNVAD